jgi:hypothetical protein
VDVQEVIHLELLREARSQIIFYPLDARMQAAPLQHMPCTESLQWGRSNNFQSKFKEIVYNHVNTRPSINQTGIVGYTTIHIVVCHVLSFVAYLQGF